MAYVPRAKRAPTDAEVRTWLTEAWAVAEGG
jgi:hypothetical protein